MKRIYLLALLFLSGGAIAGATVEWRVNLVRTGGSTVSTVTGATELAAWDNCRATAIALNPREYDCQTMRLHITVTADPPPSCSAPKPDDETRPQSCPAGTTGTWSQTRTYSAAPYPTCWTAGAWSPASAPAGACVPIPPAPVDCVVSDWSTWSGGEWSACVNGSRSRTETRTRTIVTPASNGGAACPALIESKIVVEACTVIPPDPPPTEGAIVVSPGESISAGIAKLQPGGTVIVKPGTYSAFSLKACTSTAWCTVKAEIDGTVTVTGLSIGTGNWYTSVEGFKFKNAGAKVILGSNVKFRRTAFEGGPATGNDVSVQIGSSEASPKNVLLEDSWVYGLGGRYKVLVYNADGVVLRRVVVRHDGGWTYDSRNPQGGYSLYDSRNVVCEDCLFVDPVQSLNGFEAALYLVSNGTTPIKQSNVSVIGGALIGSPNNGLAAEGNGGAATYSVTDVAVAGSKEGGFNTNNSGHTLNVSRALAKVSGYQYARWASGGALKVTDCAAGSGQLSSGASLTRCPGGEGPRLTFRVGIDGTLYGEAGFDAVTTDKLWPWPNEARIKADFDTVRPAFGGKSLTDYVWGQLGSPRP